VVVEAGVAVVADGELTAAVSGDAVGEVSAVAALLGVEAEADTKVVVEVAVDTTPTTSIVRCVCSAQSVRLTSRRRRVPWLFSVFCNAFCFTSLSW
jgi:hypothetical protein